MGLSLLLSLVYSAHIQSARSQLTVQTLPHELKPQFLTFLTANKKKPLKSQQFQGLLWQREKDSNPHIQSQSLLCYPYTIPLSLKHKPIIAGLLYLSRIIFLYNKINE